MKVTPAELVKGVEELTSWAEAKGMIGDARVLPEYDEMVIQEVFRGASLQNVTKSLQDRHISYIGYNEENSSIVIYLTKAIRKFDRDAFEGVGKGGYGVEIYQSYQLQSGSLPGNSPSPPYILNNDKYTCGSSVSVANEAAAGTIGCLLTDAVGHVYALSCNHVFAGNNYCDIGIPVIVPGQIDIRANGLDPSTIGHLHSAIPLTDGNHNIVDCSKNVDAAVIKISASGYLTSMQRSYYDTPSTFVPISGNMVVEKVGRTTGRTTGIVTSYHPTPQFIRCNISRLGSYKLVAFKNFWGIRSQAGAFSDGGDSGALVTTTLADGSKAAVGMVFAGDANLSLVVPIDQLLAHFGLNLLSGHNVPP